MNDSVGISAVLCNYNGEEYLEEAIDSVLNQERLPNEFIIVDDKSTDSSVEIIREFQNRNPGLITFIEHDMNRGQAAGMNNAFAASTGEILAFLDSDDIWFPNKLASICDVYKEQPEFGLFQHNLQIIQTTKLTDALCMTAMAQGDLLNQWHHNDTFPHFSPTSGLAIRREIFAKLAPLPVELTISSDSFLTRSSICFGPVISEFKPLGGYRKHDSNNVYGNGEHDADAFFYAHVAPHLQKFYKVQGVNLPVHLKTRTVTDRIIDLSLRKIGLKIRKLALGHD